MTKPLLTIVVPCYNEEAVLKETATRLKEKMNELIKADMAAEDSRVLFVDDGSKDATWSIIASLHAQDPLFSGIKLAHNRGHQNALMAGLMTAKDFSDAVISMDADLQDDIGAVNRFVEKYLNGCDIVYGVRSSRATDTAFKRTTAQSYYKFLEKMGVDIVYNHADYRLMSKRALEGLAEYKEVNLFLRGIVPAIGFKTDTVEYERHERFAGESKYPLKKMLALAMDGVTSFSVKPITMITTLGGVMAFISLLALICGIVIKALSVSWADLMLILSSIFLVGGLIILCLGVIGTYIGKIYGETKERPRYLIEEYLR